MMNPQYNPAETPQGVPSPYTPNVHPYPSYEHGPDYTRPEFRMPFVVRPLNVLAGLGQLPKWWPRVNRAGRPIVQPQPNPYAVHWPQDLGSITERYEDRKSQALFKGIAAATVVGAGLGYLGAAQARMKPGTSALSGAVAFGLVGALASAVTYFTWPEPQDIL